MVVLVVMMVIIIIISSSSSSSSSYNCIPETNHFSRVYPIDALL